MKTNAARRAAAAMSRVGDQTNRERALIIIGVGDPPWNPRPSRIGRRSKLRGPRDEFSSALSPIALQRPPHRQTGTCYAQLQGPQTGWSPMRRRQFITIFGGAAASWPLAAHAQRSARLPTIGYLGSSTAVAQSPWVAAFVQRLRELGWIESRTIAIEYRWAEGRTERFAELAVEFVRLRVDVIVTAGTAPALARCGAVRVAQRAG